MYINDTTIEEMVLDILVDRFRVSRDDLTMDTFLVDDLDADDIDKVELVIALEETFGTEISDDEAFNTVGDILNFMKGRFGR
jgi:acyl carrier protein